MSIERFVKMRKERGLSIAEVARALGISRSTMYRYESGDITNMPSATLKKLASLYKTTPSYLLDWDVDESNIALIFYASRDLSDSEREKVQAFIEDLTKTS